MLETAEQLLSGLGEKGIKGQDRDFTEILDVNRAAISAFDMAYHFHSLKNGKIYRKYYAERD